VAWPLVPVNTLVTSNIDRGGSLDGLRRGLMVEKVRLCLHADGSDSKHSKQKGRRDWVRVIADGESRKGRAIWSRLEGSGRNHHLLNVKQDGEKSVIVCEDGRPQASVLLLPGNRPEMVGMVTVRALCLPECVAW
jgi:hypothetical protein